jgi:putative flippase GtrA
MKISKRNTLFSLAVGGITGLFLIFVLKNPYIEEFKGVKDLPILWFLPVIFPVIFLFGTFLAEILSKISKVFSQIARFAEVGILNTAIDFGILNLLIWLTGVTGGILIVPLNAVSFMCATTNSYFWNKFWTFDSGKSEGVRGKEFAAFLIVSGIGIAINTGIVAVGTTFISPLFSLSPGAWANVMKILATFIAMTWNFLGYKFIVFKK